MDELIKLVYGTMAFVKLSLVENYLYAKWDSDIGHKRYININLEHWLVFKEDKFIVKYLSDIVKSDKPPDEERRFKNIGMI